MLCVSKLGVFVVRLRNLPHIKKIAILPFKNVSKLGDSSCRIMVHQLPLHRTIGLLLTTNHVLVLSDVQCQLFRRHLDLHELSLGFVGHPYIARTSYYLLQRSVAGE